MLDYESLPYGYSIDFNLTDSCNLQCKHCYMKKTTLSLSYDQVKKMLDKLPLSLYKIVFSGGEPFMNYEVLYRSIAYVKRRFPLARIRINSNGTLFYHTKESIEQELLKLEHYGVNTLKLSFDQYHLSAGVKKDKLDLIGSIAKDLGLKIKVSYLDIGKGVPVGEFKEFHEKNITRGRCLTRPENIFSPYLFTETSGEIHLCAFRLTKSLGNLLFDSWSTIADNILNQYDYLSGNIISHIIFNESDTELIYDLYKKYGECFLCQRHQKIS